MMADSGASVNLLAKSDYRNLHQSPSLQPSPGHIYAYDETQPIVPLGEFMAELHNKNTHLAKQHSSWLHNGLVWFGFCCFNDTWSQ